MWNRNSALILIFFAIAISIISGLSDSWLGPLYYTQRSCTDTWGGISCGGNDISNTIELGGVCNGARVGSPESVEEIYINQTYAVLGQTLKATCRFQGFSAGDEEYIYYYNGSYWKRIFSGSGVAGLHEQNATFIVDGLPGMQIVRCIIDYDGENDFCADSGLYRDNDDANFTAVAPLNYDSWGLSVADGASASRTQNVTAYTHWGNKIISLSNVSINDSGLGVRNRTIFPPYTGNWTNYTLYLANGTEFVRAGKIDVSSIYAEDDYQQGASTIPQKYFYLNSTANITNISLSNNIIYNGSSTTINCRVADSYSGAELSGYNVSFFNTTSYLGFALTNSSGWANKTYADSTQSPPRTEALKCNATAMPAMYYNSPMVAEQSAPLSVTDLRVNLASVSDTNFGSAAGIRANVTGNASAITEVKANITYYNYSSNSYAWEQVTLNPVATYSPTSTEYSANYSTKRSGVMNVAVNATAGIRSASNSTAFNVSYGSPSLSFVFPNFRVLANQTFNFTVNVTAASGDIVNPSLFLNFTNESMMNVSDGQFTKSLTINMTNGSTRSYIWNVTTSEIGLLRANVTATLVRGSNASSDTPFSVLAPIASVLSANINITQNETLVVKIVGNTSAIQSANFTVGKPYGGGAGTIAGILSGTDTESNCVGLGEGAGNIAVGANTSCNVGTCSRAVDNDTETAWTTYTLNSWITINLSAKYMVDTIEILWQGGATNTSMFYGRSGSTTGAESNTVWLPVPEFQNEDAPGEENTTVIKPGNPFETDTLLINDSTSGGFNIYEIRIYAVEGRTGQCYIYRANASVNSSGTHTVSSGVRTGSSTSPSYANATFFVNFGVPNITAASFEKYPAVGTNHIYAYSVLAQGGDLRDLNVTLSISNHTIINLTAAENASKSVGFIGYGTINETSWTLLAGSLGDKTANISVFANSTTGLGGSGYTDANVTVIFADSEAPEIHWFTLSGSSANLRQSIVVTANASDNIEVRNVTAEVFAPSFSFNQTNSSDQKKSGLWTVSIDTERINETGNYSVRLYAVDLASNATLNATLQNFTVYDTYSVLPDTNYAAYNRGENMTFRVYDVNNNTVSGAYWVVNETLEGQNTTTIYEGTNDTYFYYFASNKTSGVYNVTIYVNKSGNSGNYTGNISASSSLYITFVQPPGETTYSAGQSISSPRAKIYVKNVHNTSLANLTNVYLVCPGNPSPLALMYEYDYFYGGDTYTTQPDNPCKVPSSQGADFYLTTNATDQYNNTGVQNSSLLHTSAGSSNNQQQSSGGGGGGGGGGGVEKIIINETSNATAYVPPKIYNFNVSLDAQEIEIMQGKEITIIASVANTGDFDEEIGARNSETLLSLAYSRAITLAKSADIVVPIKIRANLSMPVGDYFISIYFSGHGIEKNRAIKVRVLENPDLPAIAGIVSGLAVLKEKMQEYVALGIDVSRVQEKVQSAEASLAEAEEASVSGDVALLAEAVEAARKYAESASAEIARYKVEKFLLENKYELAAAGVSSLAFIYFLSVFLVPYITITRRIYTLSRQESILAGARKATEMQYFVRRIDDATFHKIMTDEQDKIYKIRSEVKRLEEELALLKKLKFSELGKLKDEWRVKMKESEKARHMMSLHENVPGGAAASAFAPKKENIFMRLVQIIRGFFRKKPAYSI